MAHGKEWSVRRGVAQGQNAGHGVVHEVYGRLPGQAPEPGQRLSLLTYWGPVGTEDGKADEAVRASRDGRRNGRRPF
jgi:hypothetical protein